MGKLTLGEPMIDAVFGLPLQRHEVLLDDVSVGILEVFDRRAPFVDPNPEQKLQVTVTMFGTPPTPTETARSRRTS